MADTHCIICFCGCVLGDLALTNMRFYSRYYNYFVTNCVLHKIHCLKHVFVLFYLTKGNLLDEDVANVSDGDR